MGTKKSGRLVRRIAVSMMLGASCGAISNAAFAQDVRSAEAEAGFDIPAQSLTEALIAFGRQSGLKVAADAAMIDGLQSAPVSGTLSNEAALTQLLSGTGLTGRISNGVVVLDRAPGPVGGAMMLGPVRVSSSVGIPDSTRGSYSVPASRSATGLDLQIKETPQIVNVMTRQRIEDQNLVTIGDVIAQAPGVTVQQAGVPGAARVEYWSRGFPIASVMFDSVPTTGAANRNFDLWGAMDSAIYDRVELVQGATGLMTGAGDPSGSVNFVRKRPTDEFFAEGRISYGTWNRLRSEIDVSGSLLEDGSVRGRLVAATQKGDTWQDRVAHKSDTLYGALSADLTPDVTLNGGLLWTNIRVDDATPFGMARNVADYSSGETVIIDAFAVYGRSFNNAARWSFTEIDLLNPFLNLEWRISDDWSLRVNYMYTDVHHERLFGALGQADLYGDPELASLTYGHVNLTGEIHNLDAALSGKFTLFDRQHDVVVGGSGYWGKAHNPLYITPFNPSINVDDWNDGDIPMPNGGSAGYPPEFPFYNFLMSPYGYTTPREEQYGAYFGVRLRPTDRLSVIFGGRYNFWKRESDQYYADLMLAFFPPYEIVWLKDDFFSYSYEIDGKFTPYAGIVYEVTDDISAFVSYARVDKANIDWERGIWYVDRNLNPLPPLEVESFEGGVKAAFFDGALNVQLSIYRMEQTNNPVGDPTWIAENPSCPIQNKLGGWCTSAMIISDHGIVSEGVDFSLAGQVTDRLNIMASYSYLQQTWDGDEPYCYLATGESAIARTGKAGFNCPGHVVKLFATYQATDALTIGGGVTWKSETLGNPNAGSFDEEYAALYALNDQGAYAVVDLMARYRLTEAVTLSANVNNVFDEVYRTAIDNGNFGATFYGPPRNVMVSLGYTF